MEAAGVGLAIFPLLVAVSDKYAHISRTLGIFCQSHKYKRECLRYSNVIGVHKVRFKNECALLLVEVRRGASRTVEGVSHLENLLQLRLNDSYQQLKSTLSMINDCLLEIMEEFKIIGPFSTWRERFKSRYKLGVWAKTFDQSLRNLSTYNEDLSALRNQVEDLHRRVTPVPPQHAFRLPYLDHIHVDQQASTRLYQALTSLWRCPTKADHIAAIALDVKFDSDLCSRQKYSRQISWSCPRQVSPDGRASIPLLLSIEAFSERVSPDSDDSLTSEAQGIIDLGRSLWTLAVSDSACPTSPTIPITDRPGSASATTTHSDSIESLPDLSRHSNICFHLRSVSSVVTGSHHYHGYLQAALSNKYVIKEEDRGNGQPASIKSLREALVETATGSRSLPLPDKLRLAALLSQAVLRYHATPWLKDEWASHDVLLFGDTETIFKTPFLQASVSILENRLSQAESSNPVCATGQSSPPSPVHNPILFNLGIMLLELAFERPFRDLQEPEDDRSDDHTTYWSALRLGKFVWQKLGHRYQDAVQLCLHGINACSSGLENKDVELRFFEDVIEMLDRYSRSIGI